MTKNSRYAWIWFKLLMPPFYVISCVLGAVLFQWVGLLIALAAWPSGALLYVWISEYYGVYLYQLRLHKQENDDQD